MTVLLVCVLWEYLRHSGGICSEPGRVQCSLPCALHTSVSTGALVEESDSGPDIFEEVCAGFMKECRNGYSVPGSG